VAADFAADLAAGHGDDENTLIRKRPINSRSPALHNVTSPGFGEKKGPLARAFEWDLFVSMVVVMTMVVMPAMTAVRHAHHRDPQVDIDNAGHGAQAGLPLQAQRL
jgi:hypothetical protein